MLDRLDELGDRVGRLHLAERAGGNHGTIEVVFGEVQRVDEKRFGLVVVETAQRLQVLRLLGLFVERNHLGQRLLGSLHAHLGELIQRFLLVAHTLELACPGTRIVRIAFTPGQKNTGG